jgi:hypothetical protein
MVGCGVGAKFAVSVMGAFIVTEDELLLPEYDPKPLPVQLLKLYPLAAVALIGTTTPLFCQPLPGLTLLPPVPMFMVR